MKRKIFTFLTLFLFSFTAVFAQEKAVNEDGNYENVIRIKIKDNLVNQFDALHQKKSQTINKLVPANKGFVQTNVKALDSKNQELNAIEYKRVFRYSGKFEEQHREFGLHKWYEISFNSKKTVQQLLNAYKGINDIEHVEPVSKQSLVDDHPHPKAKNNEKVLNGLPNDPSFSAQWHYHNTGQSGGTADADIDLPEAWELETGNTNVIVAIEDQGVDYNHEDLAGNMWINTGETPNNGYDDDNNGYTDDYYGYNFGDNKGPISPGDHGTHVGGTVAAETNNGKGLAGIAGGTGNNDGVRLMSVQVFGANSQGGFAEGFVYAADMGAHISQNSWGGGGESQSINNAIDYFIANGGGYGTPMNGGVVVIAAGNSNTSSGASTWPAAYPGAIAVASTDHNDVRSSFSNYGTWVDIAAPGSDIASCAPNNSYQYMSGTSMACPHVSGVAALIVSHFAGNITPQGVKNLLFNNADPIDNLNPSYSGLLGSGRLNAYASLDGGGTPPPPPDEYCSSKGNDASYEWISKVEIGSYSNSSNGAGYTDFTSENIELSAGQSYSISLTPGFSGSTYNEYWKIWIDFNGDEDFADANELVFDAGSLSKSTVNGTINIPSTANGTTRMRVSMKYNAAQTACETFSYGEVEDYTVTFTSGGEDTQAPSTPTNLASSNVTQTSVDLSWSASTDNVGVTGYNVYQNGSLLGSVVNNSANVTGLTPATTYEFYVKAKDAAGNISGASNTISVTTLSDDIEYCQSQGNNSSYEWIDLVELNEMSNPTGNNGGYADFTNLTATVSRGAQQTIYVSCGFSGSSYTEYWHIWIDWNQNGTFESGERMVYGSSSSAAKLSATFTVPADAQLGTTRMRVTMKYNAAATACESFTYGEVEDYTINVTTTGSYAFTSFADATELGKEIPTGIEVYPNPAKDNITVSVNNGNRTGTINIYNMTGPLIKVVEIDGTQQDIDISGLPSGSYIISVDDEKEPLTKHIIKQ